MYKPVFQRTDYALLCQRSWFLVLEMMLAMMRMILAMMIAIASKFWTILNECKCILYCNMAKKQLSNSGVNLRCIACSYNSIVIVYAWMVNCTDNLATFGRESERTFKALRP